MSAKDIKEPGDIRFWRVLGNLLHPINRRLYNWTRVHWVNAHCRDLAKKHAKPLKTKEPMVAIVTVRYGRPPPPSAKAITPGHRLPPTGHEALWLSGRKEPFTTEKTDN